MPTCIVKGCTNSSKKKFKMNSLPRNSIQRSLWIKNIDRPDWVPKDGAAVCEVHFAPEMWEKTRVDGTRKLKCNAVPTIFGNQTATESTNLHTMITPVKNESYMNVLIPNTQTVIQILSQQDQFSLQQSPLAIPTLSASSTVNSKSLSNNPKVISIPTPKIRPDKPLILLNASTLTNEKAINADQRKLIFSRNSLERKSTDSSPSLPKISPDISKIDTNSDHSTLNPVTKTDNSQPVLTPPVVDTTFNSLKFWNTEAVHLTENLPITNTQVFNMENHKSHSISESMESSNQQKSEEFVSSGIILNKIEAKKKEDERFEKMDKLLLKQLKLNDALRKKLIILRRKVQRLMKNQVNQEVKQDSGSTLFLKKVFTDDQIKVLQSRCSNPKFTITWSDDTMIKAIELKKACGLHGYEEILNQNLPYPSFKTITRWCNTRHIKIP